MPQPAVSRWVACCFKLVGSLIILPFVHLLAETMGKLPLPKAELVIYFHVFYNLVRCLVMLPFVDPMARFCKTIIRDEPELDTQLRPKHLDVSALDTPTLALAKLPAKPCALATPWNR